MSIQIDIPLFLWLLFIMLSYCACFAGIRRLMRRELIARGGRP